MHAAADFEFVLLMLIPILALHLVAKYLRLPPAAAVLVGGAAIAFIPGVPAVSIDPGLVLVLFLPPLLMDGAYFTVWADFRRQIGGILLLAVGAVAFTTLVVGAVAHWAVPSLPWAACFALGAIVSPPDAISAKAVLARVRLPRRLSTLLEGESLLNDAAGLVLFKFAVAAALTGAFDLWDASLEFTMLSVGGLAVGAIVGFVWTNALRWLEDDYLMITAAFLMCWGAYLIGERLGVSGVISTVTAGLVFGWYQHRVFTASVRVRATSAWQVMVFVLEAFVFILIGLSLRGVLARVGGPRVAFEEMGGSVLAVVLAVIAARFAWVIGSSTIQRAIARVLNRKWESFSRSEATVMSWAGMRGVVTLAVALSLPATMPGRDFILVAAFAVILVTVIVQGATLGPLISQLNLKERGSGRRILTRSEANAAIASAQLKAVEERAFADDGTVLHPRMLEKYQLRAAQSERFVTEEDEHVGDRTAHYDLLLAIIAAGRAALLTLHTADQLDDEDMHALERELDLEELVATSSRR